jgi:hypothetical protein
MIDNVIEISGKTEFLIGPFDVYHVIIDGRVVPRLNGRRVGGRVTLIVDGRFSATFVDELTARQAAWLIAQASAIASGYPHFSADSKEQPFATQCMAIG